MEGPCGGHQHGGGSDEREDQHGPALPPQQRNGHGDGEDQLFGDPGFAGGVEHGRQSQDGAEQRYAPPPDPGVGPVRPPPGRQPSDDRHNHTLLSVARQCLGQLGSAGDVSTGPGILWGRGCQGLCPPRCRRSARRSRGNGRTSGDSGRTPTGADRSSVIVRLTTARVPRSSWHGMVATDLFPPGKRSLRGRA